MKPDKQRPSRLLYVCSALLAMLATVVAGNAQAFAAPPGGCSAGMVEVIVGTPEYPTSYRIYSTHGMTEQEFKDANPHVADITKVNKGVGLCAKALPSESVPASPSTTVASVVDPQSATAITQPVASAVVTDTSVAHHCAVGFVPYQATAGQTLWRIARDYGMTVDELILQSGKTDTDLFAQEWLCVVSGGVPAPVTGPIHTSSTGVKADESGKRCGLVVDSTTEQDPYDVYRWYRMCPKDLPADAAYGLGYGGTLARFDQTFKNKPLQPGTIIVMSSTGDGDEDEVFSLEELFGMPSYDPRKDVKYQEQFEKYIILDMAADEKVNLNLQYPDTALPVTALASMLHDYLIDDLASVGVLVPNISSVLVDEIYDVMALELNLRESLIMIEQRLLAMFHYNEVMEVADSVPYESVLLLEQRWTEQGHDPEEDPFSDLYLVGLEWKRLLSQAPEITPEKSEVELARRRQLLNEWINHIFSPTYDPTRPYGGSGESAGDESTQMQALPNETPPGPCGEYAMCDPSGLQSGDGTCGSDNSVAYTCAGDESEAPIVCAGAKPGEIVTCKPNIPVDPNSVCADEFGSYMCDPSQLEPGSCIQLPGASPDCEFPVDFPWWVNCTGIITVGCTQLPKGVSPPKGAKVDPFMPDPLAELG